MGQRPTQARSWHRSPCLQAPEALLQCAFLPPDEPSSPAPPSHDRASLASAWERHRAAAAAAKAAADGPAAAVRPPPIHIPAEGAGAGPRHSHPPQQEPPPAAAPPPPPPEEELYAWGDPAVVQLRFGRRRAGEFGAIIRAMLLRRARVFFRTPVFWAPKLLLGVVFGLFLGSLYYQPALANFAPKVRRPRVSGAPEARCTSGAPRPRRPRSRRTCASSSPRACPWRAAP